MWGLPHITPPVAGWAAAGGGGPKAPYLIIGRYSISHRAAMPLLHQRLSDVATTGRVKVYPDGSREYLACTERIFRAGGWEDEKPKRRGKARTVAADPARSIRRAKARLRDIALCNPMAYFVTFTLDQEKINRYDMVQITRHLNAWLSNQVQRRGLKYVLVPELHRDGAVHFHGFINAALEVVDSGTISMGGKPKRPRSGRQREQWLAGGGHVVYNLPGWPWGFTTAIPVYGDYSSAVSYVCKYIGKSMGGKTPEKIGGRWYYSGGDLAGPEILYQDIEWRDLAAVPGAYQFEVPEMGAAFVLYRAAPDFLFSC